MRTPFLASSPARRRAVTAAAAGLALALATGPVASAAPGDNGDVKVHDSTTASTSRNDDPKACTFYLDAFAFDTVQLVSWTISQQPPTGTAQVLAGSIVLTTGAGATPTYTLPDGHYKLAWTFVGESGEAKQKTFQVDCAAGKPTPTPSGPPKPSGPPAPSPSPSSGGSTAAAPGGSAPSAGPHGGVGTGGGGTSGPDTGEVLGGVGLLAGAVALGVRALRRRPGRSAAS
ncbi:hypothetical protein CFP65_7434 [Kitasatospora sp. MMS16-BH015]|uniref:hypothetical protein n=1 Tax=Kitasatospora sp. MMS16-BH015 TaxID=2018025 RepID=UPI000CA24755|nr:hypothetical protein [Kitasatospora sp. MMS16-BH015]AUG82015.1 hypothetical protein CFP65_7434 [Kitasatospora sp. MMS16-BH015]